VAIAINRRDAALQMRLECSSLRNMEFEGYQEDPEMGDENDAEYQQQLFDTMKLMGMKPEEIVNSDERAQYADWLAQN
jgi:hypothetical protein